MAKQNKQQQKKRKKAPTKKAVAPSFAAEQSAPKNLFAGGNASSKASFNPGAKRVAQAGRKR